MVRIWLDDIRTPPDGWIWAKTAHEAIQYISARNVSEVSLDHDLGAEDDAENSGYAVAKYIERAAYLGQIPRIRWSVHSANPVGRKNMEAALKKADSFWDSQG